MVKNSFIILLSILSLGVNAQTKSSKKRKNQLTEKVVVRDTIYLEKETTKPTYELKEAIEDKKNQSKTILIGKNVFVQLVFKSTVQIVRSGAPDMALVRNEDNVVTIQALQEGINSNISVKTADGLYYSYRIVSVLEEDEMNIPLFYEVSISESINGKTTLVEDEKKKIVEKMSVQEVTQTIYSYDGYIKNRNTANYRGIYITIRGVYIDKGKLYFLFTLANKSNISYKIERFQFFTMPLKKGKKRIENEEKEYVPLFYYKNITEINPKSEEVMVVVFDQFTLNDQKKLQVTMTESGGERTVKLDIDSKKIVESKKM